MMNLNYKRLLGGESITFDLKANNKVRFQKNKDQFFRHSLESLKERYALHKKDEVKREKVRF